MIAAFQLGAGFALDIIPNLGWSVSIDPALWLDGNNIFFDRRFPFMISAPVDNFKRI
jgi:hypothetical protein